MTDRTTAIGVLAGQMIAASMGAEVTWDEAVTAFGLAAKALATKAAADGDGTPESCHAQAQERFGQGFANDVKMVIVGSDMNALREAYKDAPPMDLTGARIAFGPRKPH